MLQFLERVEKELCEVEQRIGRLRYHSRLYRLLAAVLLGLAPKSLDQWTRWSATGRGGGTAAARTWPPASELQKLMQRLAYLAASSCVALHAEHREYREQRERQAAAQACTGGRGAAATSANAQGPPAGDDQSRPGSLRQRLKVRATEQGVLAGRQAGGTYGLHLLCSTGMSGVCRYCPLNC